MAISNRQRVDAAFELVRDALAKYVEQEFRAVEQDGWLSLWPSSEFDNGKPKLHDPSALLKAIRNTWNDVFKGRLDDKARSYTNELLEWRHEHAHFEPVDTDDALRILDTAARLLDAIMADQYEAVEQSRVSLQRQQFTEQVKKVQQKAANVPLAGLDVTGLRPWREIITPHEDVAKGSFQQAEFAADLWQVYKGEGTDEYRKPVPFFQRTYLTQGLTDLLANALRRLTGVGGDPVVELQINFGGGKTHSMLALYHLFGGQAKASELAGVEEVLKATSVKDAPTVARAVVVGTSMRPGSPTTKDDGTVVRTLWGEIAWQLAGRKGYDIVREADETATNPGDQLDEVFRLAGPSLILIDEWVAYARQLFDRQNMLPAGDFDTQFTFAQTLCESARRAKNVLVCISIPASHDPSGNFLTDSQVGDQAGQGALTKLKDAVGRSNMVWRPATPDESFEIVRRRLFEAIPGDLLPARDAVIKEFAAFYRANPNEFPSECRDGEYERRMKAAYPIHPELFDRLYIDWSTLEKFQRTRGVLRLMASVIHSLWKNNDGSALILPAVVPMADPTVQTEVTRYLSEHWSGVIDRDVDGASSTPMLLDGEFASSYGRYSACRRVARTVFFGSAPTRGAATRGLDEKRIKLGCVQPKETIATFGDALNKLRQRTTFLYVDGSRYWYNTQASVNREAQDRADRVKPEEANTEIVRRLRELAGGRYRGEFSAVHVDPATGDVPDDRELRLVVLGPGCPHKQGIPDSKAIQQAIETTQFRGSAPRNYRNRLVFVAADQGRLPELESAVRQYLAWASIVQDIKEEKLDADRANRQQATTSANDSAAAVQIKLGEVFQWVLVPFQDAPMKDVRWEAMRVSGQIDSLAVRVVRKLEPEHVTRKLGGTILRADIDRSPLWRDGGRVTVAQLQEDHARYTYLPRLIDDLALFEAIRDSVNRVDGLAYADAYDETTGKYDRLRTGILLDGAKSLTGVLVRPDVAMPIIEAEEKKDEVGVGTGRPLGSVPPEGESRFLGRGGAKPDGTAVKTSAKTRFHGSIRIDSALLASKAGDVSREVVQHLAKTLGSEVEIVIEIHAEEPDGFSDDIVRAVNENCRTMKFESFEFEEE